jgi:hypothetical protein
LASRQFSTPRSLYPADDPDLAWIEDYIGDPELHLTPGTWRLSAYFEGGIGDCADAHKLRADIVIRVLP